ncbi:unnamed protein product [Pleuronectes platessa]|uniref:Uncharacterized protein n=1 Tax=Pleuronectes platessa TaxID=8262 RepID=A0A9N7VN44_PLEPL|nr:unnamed protein product [Pleuronectes platessa]
MEQQQPEAETCLLLPGGDSRREQAGQRGEGCSRAASSVPARWCKKIKYTTCRCFTRNHHHTAAGLPLRCRRAHAPVGGCSSEDRPPARSALPRWFELRRSLSPYWSRRAALKPVPSSGGGRAGQIKRNAWILVIKVQGQEEELGGVMLWGSEPQASATLCTGTHPVFLLLQRLLGGIVQREGPAATPRLESVGESKLKLLPPLFGFVSPFKSAGWLRGSPGRLGN